MLVWYWIKAYIRWVPPEHFASFFRNSKAPTSFMFLSKVSGWLLASISWKRIRLLLHGVITLLPQWRRTSVPVICIRKCLMDITASLKSSKASIRGNRYIPMWTSSQKWLPPIVSTLKSVYEDLCIIKEKESVLHERFVSYLSAAGWPEEYYILYLQEKCFLLD